ncbi:MAG: universal stress protein [Pelagimonas sp.]|jgi:nucleotide-binding universal stress UspA family protein|nr:universal stress protein [Pelagimonas sp.]
MTYKTILTVVTDPALLESTVSHAAVVARAADAHLDILCIGVDRSQTGYYYAGANAVVMQQQFERAQREGEEMEAQARAVMTQFDIRWSAESGMSQLAEISRHVAARARFADLVVLPKPYGDDHGVELEPVIEAAMFEGQVPVLVVPDDVTPPHRPQRVVLAWNESSEALRAARAALPVLRGAELVHVVVVDPPQHGPNRSDPGGMLSQFLARHGVKAEINVLSKTLPRVSDVLLRHVGDVDADLIVMGAYGHSRFREAILGGATRHMLERANVTVLMAH